MLEQSLIRRSYTPTLVHGDLYEHERFRASLAALRPRAPAEELPLFAELSARIADDLLLGFIPSLVHGDLDQNILFDAREGRITDIIDFEFVRMDDPVADFGPLLKYGDRFVRTVMESYQHPCRSAPLSL
jgi:Ser/Thr protein kinase RdoA (MazF antagonist)